MSEWSVIYEKAIRDDGSLFFPERLTKEFLENARRVQGSYIFANQYQNEIIPLEDQRFRKEWFKFGQPLPEATLYNFAFIDPAISESDTADYTAIVVISVDTEQNWYLRQANRYKINPTQIINKCFELHAQYKCQHIGIEDVAYQKSLIHFSLEECRRRGIMLPITGVKRGPDKTKEMRILQLVPRIEWGRLFFTQGVEDLQTELLQFPRGAHDDLIDALASLEDIVHYPQNPRRYDEPQSPNSPHYESWYIRQLAERAYNGESD